MKFNCDKKKQRNKRKLEEFWDTHANKWTTTFAWFPIRVSEGDCRWLEEVECMWVPTGVSYSDKKHLIRNGMDEGIEFAKHYCGDWVYRPLGEVDHGG